MRNVSPPSDSLPNIYACDIIAFVRASDWIDDVDETLAKVSRVADDNPAWAGWLVKPEIMSDHPYMPNKIDPTKLGDDLIGIRMNIDDSVYAGMHREKVFGPLIEIGCLEANYTEYYRDEE